MNDRSKALASAAPGVDSWFGAMFLPEPTDVSVTQEHIDNGERGSGTSCPVVLAIREKFPELEEIDLSGEKPFIKKAGQEREDLVITERMTEWIGKYDREEEVEPFSFKVNF